MFSNLLHRRAKPAPRLAPAVSTPQHRAELGMSPSYPPKDFSSFGDLAGTVEAIPVNVLVDVTRDGLAALEHETGFHRDDFEKIVMPMVRRYYRFVHLLPASANHHHARLGGLAAHGIDVATRAARATHNSVLDFDPVHMRDLELRAKRRRLWPLAAACAGLCHDLGKVLIDQMVTNADNGDLWNPVTESLVDWVERTKVARYAIRYREGDRFHRHEAFSLLLFGSVVGPDVMGYISSLGRDVLEVVLNSVMGGDAPDPIGVRDMVAKADHDSTAADREANQSIWREGGTAVDPVLNRLLEAGNRLLRRREWRTNAPGHPVIACNEGIYLVWPQAFNLMLREIQSSGKALGIPDDPNEVAEMFLRARIATPYTLSDGTHWALWPILLDSVSSEPESAGSAGHDFGSMVAQFDRSRSALLLRDPAFLFSGVEPPDLVHVTVAPDPTLVAAVQPPAPAQVQAAPAAETPADASAGDGEGADEVGASAPAAEPAAPPQPPAASAKPTVPTAAAGATAPPGLAVATTVPEDDPPENETTEQKVQRAINLLKAHGAFGEALLGALRSSRVDPSTPVSSVFTRKSNMVLVRWPEAIDLVVRDKKPIIELLRTHPEYLAESYMGTPLDVARNGVTITVPVRAGTWNAVPLSKPLSGAVFCLMSNLEIMPKFE